MPLYKFKPGPGAELVAFPVDSPCVRARGAGQQVEARARGVLFSMGLRGIYKTAAVTPVEGAGYVVTLYFDDPLPPGAMRFAHEDRVWVNRWNLCATYLPWTSG